MDAAELRPILRRTADAVRLTEVPADLADRAELAAAAESAGATILRFAAYCRGEDIDPYGVCPDCGNVRRRVPDLDAAHKVGCDPFRSAAWHVVRLAKVVRGRARWYSRPARRRIRGGA